MSPVLFSVLREAYSRMGVSHRPSIARLARFGLLGVPDSGPRIAASMRETFAELVTETLTERYELALKTARHWERVQVRYVPRAERDRVLAGMRANEHFRLADLTELLSLLRDRQERNKST